MDILIVEDEEVVAKQLEATLHQEAYGTTTAGGVEAAKRAAEGQAFDLILLDWNLPDGDGITLLRSWREQKIPTPVLVLSANVTVDERVHALNVGADDYLCKPYSSIELLARIRALLRGDAPAKSSKLQAGDVLLDIIAREVTAGDEPVSLNSAEFDLLTLLMQHQEIVLTRYQLSEHINKAFEGIAVDDLIDIHITNIRKKLGRPELIRSVHRAGYTIKAS